MKQLLGFTPKNMELYQLAFLHASASSEKGFNNERLEFLGDAVFGLIAADHLFEVFPQGDEGFLTEMRAKIVSRRQLNEIALSIGLEPHINYQSDPKQEASIPGNSLEAVVGALYLDKGYQHTSRFVIQKLIKPHINVSQLENVELNFKSKLLEWGQKHGIEINFKLLKETQVENRPYFRMGVFVANEQKGEAADFNKKKAEQQAAAQALISIGEEVS